MRQIPKENILILEDGDVACFTSKEGWKEGRIQSGRVFVDGKGIIREVVIGGPMSEALLRIRVEQLFELGD